jgi:hypothetical protein
MLSEPERQIGMSIEWSPFQALEQGATNQYFRVRTRRPIAVQALMTAIG